MARHSTTELVEDAAGVRIDVTSPQGGDLVAREVDSGVVDRIPELEAFVRAEERLWQRCFSDWMFGDLVTAPRGEPWEAVQLRVSFPGDVAG